MSKDVNEWSAQLYPELRRQAGALFRREPSRVTLQPTALVHEAYLRLRAGNKTSWPDRRTFLAAASATMRHVLVDYARERKAEKRGGSIIRVAIDTAHDIFGTEGADVSFLDRALVALGERDAVAERVVELHFFGGFTFREIADILELSEPTVYRAWRYARTFLKHELGAKETGEHAR